jgi:hypothetical protein
MDFSIKELVRKGIFVIAANEAQQELDLFQNQGGQVQ